MKRRLTLVISPTILSEYYWIHEGANDEDAWYLLCRVSLGAATAGNNFAYVYYTASCDYTGFDCQGGMKLIASHNLKKLVESGMTEQDRELLIKDISAGRDVEEVKKSC